MFKGIEDGPTHKDTSPRSVGKKYFLQHAQERDIIEIQQGKPRTSTRVLRVKKYHIDGIK